MEHFCINCKEKCLPMSSVSAECSAKVDGELYPSIRAVFNVNRKVVYVSVYRTIDDDIQ